jgi:hypothetical protein
VHQSLKPKTNRAVRETRYILSSSLDTIEACGGGSARCMMEVFLPKLKKKTFNIEGLFFNIMLALYIRFVLLLLVLN